MLVSQTNRDRSWPVFFYLLFFVQQTVQLKSPWCEYKPPYFDAESGRKVGVTSKYSVVLKISLAGAVVSALNVQSILNSCLLLAFCEEVVV